MTNSSETIHNLDGKNLNRYLLRLGEEKQLRLSGWKGIKLYLQDTEGNLSSHPVIEGIYSRGRRGSVEPWMDLNYTDMVRFKREKGEGETIKLSDTGLDRNLFNYLGNIIPPGGHLMVSYEGADGIHLETLRALNAGIPPAATPIGHLIFRSGFQYVKDWYLAEGGHEGPRKLWGEKAPDDTWKKTYCTRTEKEIQIFLRKNIDTAHRKLLESGKSRADEILRSIPKMYA